MSGLFAVGSSTPYGSLPYIVYNGKTYGQSGPIASFLAKEFGLYGKTNADGLRIEEVHGLFEDQLQNFAKYRSCKDDAQKAELLKKILEEDAPRFFGFYERMLKENGGTGYLVGKAVTLGDFYLYDMQDNVLQLNKDALKDYPLLQKCRKNVEAHPAVKAYLAKRKAYMF
nr:hypothetical protein BaRGS_029381 [Batillaria attramentaria]